MSGVCGRLLCCLTYEQETNRELRKGLPKIGKRVYTPSGDGRVKDVNVLRRRVRVQTVEGYEEFDAEQVSPMFGPTGELLPKASSWPMSQRQKKAKRARSKRKPMRRAASGR